MATLSKTERANWLRVIAWLHQEFPPPFPVVVKTTRISSRDLGRTYLLGSKRFAVRISSQSTYSERIESLLHEWAHCLNWSYRHNREGCEHHDEGWGVQFAKLYSAYEKQFDDE